MEAYCVQCVGGGICGVILTEGFEYCPVLFTRRVLGSLACICASRLEELQTARTRGGSDAGHKSPCLMRKGCQSARSIAVSRSERRPRATSHPPARSCVRNDAPRVATQMGRTVTILHSTAAIPNASRCPAAWSSACISSARYGGSVATSSSPRVARTYSAYVSASYTLKPPSVCTSKSNCSSLRVATRLTECRSVLHRVGNRRRKRCRGKSASLY